LEILSSRFPGANRQLGTGNYLQTEVSAMVDRPVLLIRNLGGGGLMLALEFPPGVAPGPVMLSQAVKDNLIIELTGQHPISDDWRRLPTVNLAPERRAGGVP
jgi:hypothetical protein